MRVIKYLLTTLFLILVIAVIGFFAAREVLLVSGVNKVKDSLEVLKLSAARNVASTECAELAGGELIGDDPIEYQLRFLNDQDYILEAVCPLSQSNPIELGKNSLPAFVTKTPGKSGFIWSDAIDTGIELQVFADIVKAAEENSYSFLDSKTLLRSRKIVVSGGMVNSSATSLPKSQEPAASCEGYGYTCCDTITQVGAGGQLSGTPQCTDSCYSQCLDRPVILSFSTNPFFDVDTRQVEVSFETPVTFAFVVDEKDAENLKVTISFGDGDSETFSTMEGRVTHQYACQDAFCSYTAEISAIDENGLESVETPISKLDVEVNR